MSAMSSIASIGRFSLPLANAIAIVGSMDVAPISVAAIAIPGLCFPLFIAVMPPIVAPMMGVVDVEAILVVGRCRVVSIATMSIPTMSIASMSIATVSRVYLGHMDRGGAVVAIGAIGGLGQS